MGKANRTGSDGASLAGGERGGEGRAGFRAVGVPVSRLAAPLIARRGGGLLTRLKAEWAAIAGRDWAECCWPQALSRDGTLRLRVATAAAALELQHRAPLLVERINVFFGRGVVVRLALLQGPLPLAPAAAAPQLRQASRSEAAAVERRLEAVADPALHNALARLGRAIAAAAPGEVAPVRDDD